MKWYFNNLVKNRFVWHLTIVAMLLLSLVSAVFIPKGANIVSASDLIVTRQLPVWVSPGQTFDVQITFTAPANGFGLIGVVDTAPNGWTVAVSTGWCTPPASDVLPNKVEYLWYGPYDAGTQFNVVYKVTVPQNASPGNYPFTNGDVGYRISGGSPIHAGFTGDSQGRIKFPPTLITSGATEITTSTVNLRGSLASLGDYSTVNVYFQWGADSGNLNQQTPLQINTSAPADFSASLTGLTSNTAYYFRAIAIADGATAYGNQLDFTTTKLPPVVTTYGATDTTTSTVNLHGNLSSLGDYSTVNVSFEWGTVSGDLNQQTSLQLKTSAPVDFSASLASLTSNTLYYFRAKATAAGITVYGDKLSFNTSKLPPVVTTYGATDTTTSTVNLHGNLSGLGDYTTVNVSFEWGTVPDNLDQQTALQPKTSAPVDFDAALTGLTSNTLYYFRAKATAAGVTVYGDKLSFTTAKAPPIVITFSATDITTNTVILRGNLDSLGDYTTVNISLEWGTIPGNLNQQTALQTENSAPMDFNVALTGLTSNTLYYFRAKAIVAGITVYGDKLSFTTAKIPPIVTTSGTTDITTSTATLNGNLSGLGDYTSVTVSFEWGTTSGNLDHQTTLQAKSSVPVDFDAVLTGLTSNTRYYCRAKAASEDTSVYGDELSFTAISVTRQLPEKVLRGKTFEVTISFNAPVNQFGQIEIIDVAPDGWAVAADETQQIQTPDDTNIAVETPNRAEFVWNGSYVAGTLFSVVYQVAVPADAPLQYFTFGEGQVRFSIAGGASCVADIGGNSQTEVISGSTLKGKTYEVNGKVLANVTIDLIKDGVLLATTVSDAEGNYTIIATQSGNHTLIARKSGFKNESCQISVAVLGQEYTLNFKGKHGIISNAPNIWYVLDCAALWKYQPVDTELTLDIWKVLDVAAAWKYPIY